MPLYDIECDNCGFSEDYFCKLDGYEHLNSGQVKCECSGRMRIRIHPVATVGVLPSKPLNIPNAGQAFTSNSQLRKWKKDNPDQVIYGPNDKNWERAKDKLTERVEKKCQSMGTRDPQHFKESRQADNARKKELALGMGGTKKFFSGS